jgi:hypothetical protein
MEMAWVAVVARGMQGERVKSCDLRAAAFFGLAATWMDRV